MGSVCDVLVTSRSYAEYVAMFDLDAAALRGAVLDCSAGSSSFVAEFVRRGGQGVAVDPAYALSRVDLAAAATRGLDDGSRIIDRHDDRFVWDWYGTPQRRYLLRHSATERFLSDLDHGSGWYVAGALPTLPFADRSYDLVLCSHLLFTWSTQLDDAWHLAAITELLRVTRREIRIYPLVVQGSGDAVPFFDRFVASLDDAGHCVEIRRVPYVFQRGAESMLTVRPAPDPAPPRRTD
jgi:SAM-dependent methyltransferase